MKKIIYFISLIFVSTNIFASGHLQDSTALMQKIDRYVQSDDPQQTWVDELSRLNIINTPDSTLFPTKYGYSVTVLYAAQTAIKIIQWKIDVIEFEKAINEQIALVNALQDNDSSFNIIKQMIIDYENEEIYPWKKQDVAIYDIAKKYHILSTVLDVDLADQKSELSAFFDVRKEKFNQLISLMNFKNDSFISRRDQDSTKAAAKLASQLMDSVRIATTAENIKEINAAFDEYQSNFSALPFINDKAKEDCLRSVIAEVSAILPKDSMFENAKGVEGIQQMRLLAVKNVTTTMR